jgi:hypothetical protein
MKQLVAIIMLIVCFTSCTPTEQAPPSVRARVHKLPTDEEFRAGAIAITEFKTVDPLTKAGDIIRLPTTQGAQLFVVDSIAHTP